MQKNSSGKLTEESKKLNISGNSLPKPFLKWAGGKGQLLKNISSFLPENLEHSKDLVYVEPFVGSGAVLFWILKNYKNVKKAVINDINEDLINGYISIKYEIDKLLNNLKILEENYYHLKEEEQRKAFFLEKREAFNNRNNDVVKQSALLIFLNKTCFNGLYRVNRKNKFNVPFGRYKNPKICDTENLKSVNQVLQNVIILNKDFEDTLEEVDSDNSFFYFDPPYKPISKTASFNSYSNSSFDDKEQRRLKKFCDKLNEKNIKWLLSNSDVKNNDQNDNFFDDLYEGYFIERIKAKRAINSNGKKRGEITELLIKNYE